MRKWLSKRIQEGQIQTYSVSQHFSCGHANLWGFVRPSVGWLVGRSVVIELESVKTRISTPAHPSATGMAVYPALFVALFVLLFVTIKLGNARQCNYREYPPAPGDVYILLFVRWNYGLLLKTLRGDISWAIYPALINSTLMPLINKIINKRQKSIDGRFY